MMTQQTRCVQRPVATFVQCFQRCHHLCWTILDIGEAAVIHTALTEGIITVAIDELKGRRVARLHGLQVTGSLGMLVMLYQQGVVPSIEQAIQRIQDKGIFLSERIIQEAIAATQTKG